MIVITKWQIDHEMAVSCQETCDDTALICFNSMEGKQAFSSAWSLFVLAKFCCYTQCMSGVDVRHSGMKLKLLALLGCSSCVTDKATAGVRSFGFVLKFCFPG